MEQESTKKTRENRTRIWENVTKDWKISSEFASTVFTYAPMRHATHFKFLIGSESDESELEAVEAPRVNVCLCIFYAKVNTLRTFLNRCHTKRISMTKKKKIVVNRKQACYVPLHVMSPRRYYSK